MRGARGHERQLSGPAAEIPGAVEGDSPGWRPDRRAGGAAATPGGRAASVTSLGGASAQPGLGTQRRERRAERIAALRAHAVAGMERYKGEGAGRTSLFRGKRAGACRLDSGDQNGLSTMKGPQPKRG